MIIFKKIEYKNFLSTGDNPITVDLTAVPTTLMVGENGSGKSSMQESLSYALYGKTLRGINKGQVINAVNGKNCLVTVDFETEGKQYRIVRGLKPNIFEIWCDGVLVNQESHARDYQTLLEKNILKLDFRSFGQIVVLGSASFVPFMQLPAWHRREVIEDLLDIGIFTKMHHVLKDQVSARKSIQTEMTSKLESIKKQVELQARHIDKMRSIASDESDSVRADIDELEKQIVLEASNNATDEASLVACDESALSRVLNKAKTTSSKYTTYKAQIEAKVSAIEKDVSFYKKNDSCPTCASIIDKALRSEKISTANVLTAELKDALSKLQESIDNNAVELDDIGLKLNDAREIRARMTSRQTSIDSINVRIGKMYRRLATRIASADIIKAGDELRAMEEEEIRLLTEHAKLTEDKAYDAVIAEMLKDTGIRTMIIRQYLPVMNKLINHYLQTLDFFVSFTLDENFNEIIKSRHRDEFTYASFSEGERTRIDLALLFTWRQIAKLKNSSSTNLLILDEVADGSLSATGFDNMLKIIDLFKDDTNIFVISHRIDGLDGKFNRKLEFSKSKNFTVMTAGT